MSAITKKEADRWDRVIDAAADLVDLIESGHFAIDEYDLEELTIFLAQNGVAVRKFFARLKRTWPME